MPAYIKIRSGDRYGCYTVIGKADREGKQEFYDVKCNTCGHPAVICKSQLRTRPKKCVFCRGREYSEKMRKKREELLGQVINGFRILEVIDTDVGETAKYLVECIRCGNRSIKTLSNMKFKQGDACDKCPPNYHIINEDSYATGTLPNGMKFKIDKEDVHFVQDYFWYVNDGGYMFRRDRKSRVPHRLHREVLGLKNDDPRVVDHLNHDKLDNRKVNLSIGTQADNCLNNIKKANNTIGHVGVQRSGSAFTSTIQKHGISYSLITTRDIVEAAQAYNVAADYLFGVGIGYRNQVMYPSQEFICAIIDRVKEIQSESVDKAAMVS